MSPEIGSECATDYDCYQAEDYKNDPPKKSLICEANVCKCAENLVSVANVCVNSGKYEWRIVIQKGRKLKRDTKISDDRKWLSNIGHFIRENLTFSCYLLHAICLNDDPLRFRSLGESSPLAISVCRPPDPRVLSGDSFDSGNLCYCKLCVTVSQLSFNDCTFCVLREIFRRLVRDAARQGAKHFRGLVHRGLRSFVVPWEKIPVKFTSTPERDSCISHEYIISVTFFVTLCSYIKMQTNCASRIGMCVIIARRNVCVCTTALSYSNVVQLGP